MTVAAGSLTSLPANLTHFDAPLEALGILRTDHPHFYRGRHEGETEDQFVDRIVGNLEKLNQRLIPAILSYQSGYVSRTWSNLGPVEFDSPEAAVL